MAYELAIDAENDCYNDVGNGGNADDDSCENDNVVNIEDLNGEHVTSVHHCSCCRLSRRHGCPCHSCCDRRRHRCRHSRCQSRCHSRLKIRRNSCRSSCRKI